jgi:hypothetical protein
MSPGSAEGGVDKWVLALGARLQNRYRQNRALIGSVRYPKRVS